MDIKLKITLWYTLLALLTSLIIGFLLLGGAREISERYYRDTLSAAAMLARDEVEYKGKELEIDDDLNAIPDVHISLYTRSGTLLYGKARFSLPFEEGLMRREMANGGGWYILDVLMAFDQRGDVWMRCAKLADAENATYAPILRLMLVLLPLIIVLMGAGGFFIARRAFRPVAKMARTAGEIASGGDLKKRVGLGAGGKDELSMLAHTLDAMLSRLDESFLREQRFTSDAAHELRTPLNAMRLLCEEARSDVDSVAKDQILDEMIERMESFSGLLSQLLSLSRMDANSENKRFERIALSELLMEVVREVMPVAEDAGITLQTEVQEGVFFLGDEAQMRRLAANLLSNSIRYGRRGGYAKVTLRQTDGELIFAVSDSGIGIGEEELSHIWERFWRADSSRTSSGNGLGLSIARSIIERHGGRIKVTSALGVGTDIQIYF